MAGFPDQQKQAGPAFFNLGNAYYFLKEYRKAADAFNNALIANSVNKDYHFNMANTCLELEEVKSAIYHFKKVIELDVNMTYQNTMSALMSLGRIYSEKVQDSKRANKVYKKMLKLYPEDPKVKFFLMKVNNQGNE